MGNTVGRAHPMRETSELVAATHRLIRAIGRRAADDDVDSLRDIVGLQNAVHSALLVAVLGHRAAGTTWEDIGDALGVTRQAVIMRFGGQS